MNLAQVRSAFKTLSGRYDLTDSGDTTILDNLINNSCKYLDRISETQKTWATHYVLAPAGSWYVQFPHCRAVKEVWFLDSNTNRWQMEKKNLQTILGNYLTKEPSLLGSGTSLFYSPAITRVIPEDEVLDPSFASFADIINSDGHGYNAILFAPPIGSEVLVEIVGLFYSMKLIEDEDENFWSSIHPMLLVKAVLREVEVFNRNTQGVKDWDTAIVSELDGINKDLVDELIAETDQMQG